MKEFKGRQLRVLALLMLIAFGMSVLQPGVAGAQHGPSCTVTVSGADPGFVVTLGAGTITFVANANAVGGLQTLVLLAGAVNANVTIPVFTVGTLSPVTVTFTVVDPTKDADFAVQAGDQDNHHAVIAAVHCVGTPAVCNPNICVVTQGFWKNHPQDWPVTTLNLGTVTYNQTQLLAILGEPVRGNGLVSLSKQLIAAKLNQANGACVPTAVATAITQADALIGSAIVPPVGTGFLAPSATSALNTILDNYNNGLAPGGPSHCQE